VIAHTILGRRASTQLTSIMARPALQLGLKAKMFCTRSQRSMSIFTFSLGHRQTLSVWQRTFVTHQDAASSSLLSSALDQKQRASRLNREDSVGPFTLGISEASLKHGKKVKQWSELSTGGKGACAFHHFLISSTCHITFILTGNGNCPTDSFVQ
jgi:hypothetical protein